MLSSAGLIRTRPRATPPAIHIFGRPIFYSPILLRSSSRSSLKVACRWWWWCRAFPGLQPWGKAIEAISTFFFPAPCRHIHPPPLFIMGVARLAAWSGLDCLNLVKLLLLPTLTVPHPPVHSGTAQFQTRLVLWHRSSLCYVLARGEKHETKVRWTLACSIWILMWKILIKIERVPGVTMIGWHPAAAVAASDWESNKRGGGPDRFSGYEQREVEISLICQARQQGGVGWVSECNGLESSFCSSCLPSPWQSCTPSHGPINQNCIATLYLGNRVGSAW